MPKINIPASNIDLFYRYKRHTAEIAHQRKNGGETILKNADIICRELGIDSNTFNKYLKKKLNCQVTASFCIRKIITSDEIEEIIEKFITEYIICNQCGNPEFEETSKVNVHRCKACGFKEVKQLK